MKQKTIFVCSECGSETPKWLGRCTNCGEWNTIYEQKEEKATAYKSSAKNVKPTALKDIASDKDERIKTNIKELDNVLGGGIVKGSLVLVGGEPGIGKSTLLLQICNSVGKYGQILYVSGEESDKQLKLRADRLSIDTPSLLVLPETDIDAIIEQVKTLKPVVVIVDSVQTMFTSDLTSASGSVGQVREVTMRLMSLAKESDTTFFIVGHVTKEGSIAGPRVLEHMVDAVLYFEGERHQSYRILRAVKNRFGSTNEIGVFEMQDKGLVEVLNPSAAMLSGRPENACGSAVVCMMEGTRPILAEVQALVSPTGFGIPRRTAKGVDYNRMVLLIAVLEKRLGLNFSNHDAYLNVAGGIKVDETACDLAIVCSLISSLRDKPADNETVFLGEVGLTGEIRAISGAEKRVMEIKKMGFKRCVLPLENAKNIKTDFLIESVSSVKELLRFI